MIVEIKCELSENCEKLGEEKMHELADFLSEFFNDTYEYFEVERKRS